MESASTFDTMVEARKLAESGDFSRSQAEAIVTTIRNSQAELVTKSDIREIKAALANLENKMDGMATKVDLERAMNKLMWLMIIAGFPLTAALVISLFGLVGVVVGWIPLPAR